MPSDDQGRRALSRLADVTNQILIGKSISQYGALCVRVSRNADEPLFCSSQAETPVFGSSRKDVPCALDPHAVAEQKAWEEAGVIGDAEKEPCGFYTYVKSLGNGARVSALVHVHISKVERLGRKFSEKSQRSLR